MNNYNITAYKNKSGEYLMGYGKGSIKTGYYIANGDERFYHYLGANAYYSIPEILHPDDVECFMDAIAKLDEEPQCLIARLKNYNNEYRFFYMVLVYNGKVFNDFRSFDMEMCEIMSITDKYLQYSELIEKYREFMTLFTGMFFEYEFGSGMLKIYEYRNSQSKTVFHEALEDINTKIMSSKELSATQKSEFQILYESLKKGREHFKTSVDAVLFHEQADKIRYEFKFSTMYKEDIRDKVVGLISVISQEQPKKSYYLSENAFDPGTGLLNKRAINEYAIEKIQNGTEGLYLVIMDVDDFKKINDAFGHMFGDEVLSKVAEIIRSVMGSRGVAGRFGGDEFMIVLEGIDSEETLRRILSTIERHAQWAYVDVEGVTVTMSIGVSKYPEDGTTYEELFQKADKSVYIAKAKGKNRYIIYDEKKHGAIQKGDRATADIGLKVTVSDEKKHTIISDLVLRLNQTQMGEISSVMEQVQTCFDIDGIAVYAGEDMRRVASVGNYVNPIQNLTFANDAAYLGFFDQRGFYEENRVIRLENKVPVAYKMYVKQECAKLVQCMVRNQDRTLAVVSFDYFNRFPKMGTTDIGLIKIIGRLMAEIAAKAYSD